MELATGPLPSWPPTAMPAEHRADPWGDFLQRVLVAVGPTKEVQAEAEPPLGALPRPEAPSGGRAGLPIE